MLLRGFDPPTDGSPSYRGGFVSIGNFDGVHRGHRAIVGELVRRAGEANRPAIVLTFDPHPIRLLRPEAEPPSLVTVDRKAELLHALGVDFVIAYPTDRALLELSPGDFFANVIRDRLDAAGLVEGPNFYFGKGRAGNVETLRELCESASMSFDVVEPVRIGDEDGIVSSSRIRTLVEAGRVREAALLLGAPYRLSGVVGHGAGRGRSIGVPTANLTDVPTLLPAAGVYAARTDVVVNGTSESYAAAVNIGPNPTFGEESLKIEAHLVGFSGDLYDQVLHVDLLERIRDVETFDDVSALEARIAKDIAATVDVVSRTGD